MSVNPAEMTASARSPGVPFEVQRLTSRPAMNSITFRFTSAGVDLSFPARVASDRSTSPSIGTRRPLDSKIDRIPRVWRRRPYGSAVPVGINPTPKQPHTMSILSAIATETPTSVPGSSSACPLGR